jgi:hypothetical protein
MANLALSKVSTRARIALSIVVVIMFLLIGGFAWWLTDATVKDDAPEAVTGVANESNSDGVQSDAKNETESALSPQEGAASSIEEPPHMGSNKNRGGGSTKPSYIGTDGEPSQAEDVLPAVDVARLLTE